jgi:hypothetical protein
VKRTLICATLVVCGIFCFWYAFFGIDALSGSADGAKSADQANGAPSAAGHAAKAAPAAPRSNSATDGMNVASSSATPSSATGLATSSFICKSQCQSTNSACQSVCYQLHPVTNDTQYWNQCMQSCVIKSSICSNDCVAGVSPSSTSPTALMSPPAQASRSPPPLSAPTPSWPTRSPDDSSSSLPSSSSPSQPRQ